MTPYQQLFYIGLLEAILFFGIPIVLIIRFRELGFIVAIPIIIIVNRYFLPIQDKLKAEVYGWNVSEIINHQDTIEWFQFWLPLYAIGYCVIILGLLYGYLLIKYLVKRFLWN